MVRHGTAARAIAAALLAVTASPIGAGCSFTFVESPPSGGGGRLASLDCTTGYGWPVVDTVVAALQIARVALALSRTEADYAQLGSPALRNADIAAGVASFGIFSASAVVGYSRVAGCNHARRSSGQPSTPGGPLDPTSYPPPPPYGRWSPPKP